MSDRRKAAFDLAFALLHLAALLAVAVYAVVSLLRGDNTRFALIAVLLAAYYVFMLHPAVKKEIARRKSLKGPRQP
jgi:hypothetical protein